MRRILLSVCLLVVVASCARIEQRAAERTTVAAGSAPVSTTSALLPTQPPSQPVLPTEIPPTQSAAPTPLPTALAAPTAPSLAGDFLKPIEVNGAKRSYLLHVPPAYDSTKPVALVLNFHGHGSNAIQEAILSDMSKKADAENFIVVYPEGSRNPQQWGITAQGLGRTDMLFVRALLEQLQKDYAIDPQRIYATGFSNGAEFTNLLACNMAEPFAAVAMVAGGYFYGLPCETERPLPVLAFHGTADNVLPYENDTTGLMPVHDALDLWALRNACADTPKVIFQKGNATGELWGECREKAEVVLFTIKGGGHSWPGSPTLPRVLTTQDANATDIMWLFFVTHPKP